MQRKKKLKEIDTANFKILPAIKNSSKSNPISPKNIITAATYALIIDQIDLKPSETQEELHLKESLKGLKPLHTVKYPQHPQQKKSFDHSLRPDLLADTHKIMLEEDSISKVISRDYMQDTISSNIKKTSMIRSEEEFKRDGYKKNRYKEIELFNVKKKNDDYLGYIETLLKESSELKIKNKSLEDNLARVNGTLSENEGFIKSAQNSLKICETKLAEKENEVKYKQAEYNEIVDLLKKSEDKRKSASEYSSSIESSLIGFQRKITELKKANMDLKTELAAIKNESTLKDSAIISLQNQISAQESAIEAQISKNTILSLELEKSKETLKSFSDQNSLKAEKLLAENSKLQELITQLQQDLHKSSTIIRPPKKSETFIESQYFSDLSRDEALRWHSRYFNLEQELLILKDKYEKAVKNELYYKTQVQEKNVLLGKLENFANSCEKIEELEENSPLAKSNTVFSEVSMINESLGNRAKGMLDCFKCLNCFKFSINIYICFPCGHLCCSACKFEVEMLCGKCTERVINMAPVPEFSKLAEFYLELTADIEKTKNLLNSAC